MSLQVVPSTQPEECVDDGTTMQSTLYALQQHSNFNDQVMMPDEHEDIKEVQAACEPGFQLAMRLTTTASTIGMRHVQREAAATAKLQARNAKKGEAARISMLSNEREKNTEFRNEAKRKIEELELEVANGKRRGEINNITINAQRNKLKEAEDALKMKTMEWTDCLRVAESQRDLAQEKEALARRRIELLEKQLAHAQAEVARATKCELPHCVDPAAHTHKCPKECTHDEKELAGLRMAANAHRRCMSEAEQKLLRATGEEHQNCTHPREVARLREKEKTHDEAVRQRDLAQQRVANMREREDEVKKQKSQFDKLDRALRRIRKETDFLA